MHNYMVVDRLGLTMAALADPTRRAILARLRAGPASVAELAEPFAITQQAVSKHLAYLERAQLVRTSRVGRQQIRELDPAPIRELATWADEYRSYWREAFGRLRHVLEQEDRSRRRRKGDRGTTRD